MTKQFYAQAGEDAILSRIFEGKKDGTCLEIGALDGIKDSITLHFEKKGWSCILIEANPELAEKARTSRQARVFCCAAGRSSGVTEFIIAKGAEYLSTANPTERHICRILNDGATIETVNVPVMPVDDALEEAAVSLLDFATIDVEGGELEVLEGFDLCRWRPRVLVIEDNDDRVPQYLRAKGYRCFLHDGLNNWYARKSDCELLTRRRVIAEFNRRTRHLVYTWTLGWLPLPLQHKIVSLKRKWLGRSSQGRRATFR